MSDPQSQVRSWNLQQFGIDEGDSDSSEDMVSLARDPQDPRDPLESQGGLIAVTDTASVDANHSSNGDNNAHAHYSPQTVHVPQSLPIATHVTASVEAPMTLNDFNSTETGSSCGSNSSRSSGKQSANSGVRRLGSTRYLRSGSPSGRSKTPTFHNDGDVLRSASIASATPSCIGDIEDEQDRADLHTQNALHLLDVMTTAGDTMTMEEVLQLPFPLFVFGTLRMHLSNNYLMGIPCENECAPYSVGHFRRDHELTVTLSGRVHKQHLIAHCEFKHWAPAGVRQMHCDGLKILPNQARNGSITSGMMSSNNSEVSDHFDSVDIMNSAAQGEVYVYDDANFAKAIRPVDELESFTTTSVRGTSYQMGSYVRTLMWADILPYHLRSWLTLDLSRKRTWPKAAFAEGAQSVGLRMPVWVYSSVLTNIMLSKNTAAGTVLIWAPHPVALCEVPGGDPEFDLLDRARHSVL